MGQRLTHGVCNNDSDGGMPGRMVLSHEPKEVQTRCGKAT